MKSKKILLAAAVFYFGMSEAQQSQYFTQKENYRFNLAENLYQTKIYNASQYEYARQYFYNQNLSQSKKEAAQFFDNVIGVILQKNHAEEGLTAFIKEYPNSAYFAQANLPLADYYLAKKDFKKALETLKKVNQYQLTREENTQYILKLGYAKFMMGDSKGAIDALEEAYKTVDESEKGDVAYMLGHLYYSNKQNDQAFQYFDTVKDQPKFSKLVRPYYVQMHYNDKDYDKAISEGTALLNEDISESYKAEVHKIIGESYFMKNDYAAAYPHLKDYLSVQQNPSENDLYEMGFVAAQLKKYDEAVSYYNQLINSNSALAQNAYYQLGNAYLAVDKKQEALSAFRSSYQMDYDASVKQLAHEQYAKLGYDIGNPFESPTAVIQDYITANPSGTKNAEMRSLLVKSYLYSGNFKETLNAIDTLPNSTPETDKVDQEVSYLLGTEEFNKGNFDEAEKYFLRSLEFDINKEFNSRALYWLGQVYYQKGNYPSAIVRYEKLLNETFPEKQQLPYDLGYAYFKSKKFDQAENYFKQYLTNPKIEFKNDAELRLADINYANNNLDEAIAIYDKNEESTDYTLYQKSLALGFKGDNAAKISNLKSLISTYPDSEYQDDAQYEIGSAYAALDDFANSNDFFGKVIKSSSDKDLVANASIFRAQNYIEQNQSDKALSELKALGNQYKNTPYAQKVVQAAKPIFTKNGDVSGYADFANSIGVNIDAAEIDEINLSTGKQYFVKKDYKNAISYYEKYLTQNPTGEGLYQAKYELGESYYQTNNSTKALLVLQEVADVQNDYQDDAQTRLVQIFVAQGNMSDAKKYLENLKNSSNINIRNYANIELMKVYAEEKNFSQAEKLADAVIANNKNSAAVIETAKVIKARSLMNSGKDKDAQTAYSALEKSSNTEVAAEALYSKAFYQNKGKAFKSSNETIFKLANNYASEDYWGAKALVLMAKNYIGLKDNYQASYTCDQIIANYSDFPEIVAEAKEVKKQIKK
ncbi:Lipopolysaccharide assembly protein B [Chryseobacterium aquaeductus]|uniref:Lipopolysaccharide assembly protein B n=1 Tax=Chryseobacterium aquaeductus TaxID=2675056 RepID=A0A9N8QVI0_9FLAO|nr:tetratricopeptide repeat protein [Chryseobacterium aquaeductus]CAA7331888.1 Lipopolysaccharide assembly protein B [Chryseobacterium potabilaquae]CAD7813080.1 Lipopolysaccharide assembly protein B [Chryseobacterium aquaeductus]